MAKYHEYIREAVRIGYTFDFDNQIMNTPYGNKIKPKLFGTQRYPSFTLSGKRSFTFHKFVAYILYGEESFKEGINVRHLDGNVLNLSKSNIVLGTSSENQLDKPKHIRKAAASKARLSQGRPTNSILDEEDVRDIRKWHAEIKQKYPVRLPNGTLEYVRKWYGLSRSGLGSIIYNKNWKDINVQS